MAFRIRNNNLLKMTSMEYFCSGELGALASDTSHSLPDFSSTPSFAVYNSDRLATRLCVFLQTVE